MAEPEPWRPYQPTHAFFVALDIVGFSHHLQDPDQLLAHRKRLFQAIQDTTLMREAMAARQVAVHFLGDELRLAFQDSVASRRYIASYAR